MRVILAAAILALLAGPSLAQQEQHMRGYREADPEKSPAQKAADKAAAEAYKRSLRSIPDQGPSDPWGGVRANDGSKPGAAKTATKTAKSKAKTGNTETRPQ